MTKSGLVIFFFIAVVTNLHSQDIVDYELCGKDFRPLYMHPKLLSNSIYTDTLASAEKRAKDLIKRLSFDEKLEFTGGWNKMHFPGISHLGIPPVYFADASQGIHRKDICVKIGKTTAFPSSIALAATWNPVLVNEYAKSIGEECRAWGVSVLLGPGLNMYRNSEGGRNYEYYGEDPYLVSRIAVAYVKGLQSQGIIAAVKHFIGNDQEFARHIADVQIGERALHEIYLPPFKAAINEGGALAVMTGNNFVNGYPGAANKPLTQGILRSKYGFKGLVMSDWASTQFWPSQLDKELTSGHSLLMPNNDQFKEFVKHQIENTPEKKVGIEKELDTMVFHNLYAFFKAGVYDRPYRNPALVKKIENHKHIALKTAEEGITLLKNQDNILPIGTEDIQKILVLGTDEALNIYTGRGSGKVEGYNIINYLDGLKKTYGDKIIRKSEVKDDDINSADVVLYFVNKPAGEGFDIPYDFLDITTKIEEIAKLNKNIVVVYSGGNGLPTPWLKNVKGLVFAYLLGQEGGAALANVISGKVNPSGKLPFSVEKNRGDGPAKDYNKMKNGGYYWRGGKVDSRKIFKEFGTVKIKYDEGVNIGYRWYDKHHIQTLFPFGYGLSYTKFEYKNIRSSKNNPEDTIWKKIEFELKNVGELDGAEIAQLYIKSPNSTIERPLKELKGFKKVFLNVGETKTISIPIKIKDLAFWNESIHDWQVDHGNYEILVGGSSQDIQQKIKLTY